MDAHEIFVEPIGRVLRASTLGFSAGTQVSQIDTPTFGMVVKVVPTSTVRETVYGLLFSIHIDDDPLVRQLVLADRVDEETIRDQHHHRIVPVEMDIISIGYRTFDGTVRYALPPRPPISLDPVYLCEPEETRQITQRFDYFPVILGNRQIPSEQLLAATLVNASLLLPRDQQYDYLVRAGREAARLLNSDLSRLDNLLRLIYPNGGV